MRLRLRDYHMLRQEAQIDEEILEFSAADAPSSICELVSLLAQRLPGLRGLQPSLVFARNGEFATAETPVADGDTIDIMPPFCGG